MGGYREGGDTDLGLLAAPVFIDVQRQVASLIRDKILVGYGLWEFLSVRGGLPSDERAEAYSRSVAGYGPRTPRDQHA